MVLKMKKLNIYFDMDGTIANLYEYKDWLKHLRLESIAPYEFCQPMVDMKQLKELLQNPIINSVNIISWTSKHGTTEYNRKTRYAKIRWLAKNGLDYHLIDKYIIIPYGTDKADAIGKLTENDILFDDEKQNRSNWIIKGGHAEDEKNLIEKLKRYIDKYTNL